MVAASCARFDSEPQQPHVWNWLGKLLLNF
jgi:hypothetical protein